MESHSSPRRWDRWIAAALLLATSAIHIALVPQHLHEAPYAGVLFIALSAGGMVTATALVLAPHQRAWLAAGALASGAVASYVVSRSIGLPALEDDVGDWLNPLGVAAVLVETATVLLCAAAGRQNRSAASRAAASARSRSDRTSPVSVGW